MKYDILQEKYTVFCQLVIEHRIAEAFIILKELTEASHNGDLIEQAEHQMETYHNILQYSFGEIEDPEKKTVYFRLLRSALELADETRESIINANQLRSYSSLKIKSQAKSIMLVNELQQLTETLNLENNFAENESTESYNSRNKEEKTIIKSLFDTLWLADKFGDTEKKLVQLSLQGKALPWWYQSLVISAITLSLQRYFDETKLNLLAKAYMDHKDQVWERALIGLVICLYQYNSRIFLYPKTKELLEYLQKNSEIEKHSEALILQLIKVRDTEKITRQFTDEIFPEISRIQNRIDEKMDMKNLSADPFSDEKNPDWENVFQDAPGLMDKLEKFSKLQMEGSDVFMGTFANLKHFDFFNESTHWFIPFYKENTLLVDTLKDEKGTFNVFDFISDMENSSVLCNSDKYSFCLSINRMPSPQRSMVVDVFKMEVNALKEVEQDDELFNKPIRERIIFTQYLQDLYRFNKLYQGKNEYYDVFSTNLDIYNTFFFRDLIIDDVKVRNIGEFLFEKKHYHDAIMIFQLIDKLDENYELWQKIAYSFQQLGNIQKALDYYLKADLADTRYAWNIKKIALCYRRLGNHTKALEYYLEANKLEPDNLPVQANLAHTYFELKDFENALKIYFKVEFLAPDNHKIERPIAWCSFMLQKLETARTYFEKILHTEGNQHDLLNLGHIEWCLGNKPKAIERYIQCLQKAGSNFEWFTNEFMADSEILVKNGIDEVDIPLMRDYLKILSDNRKQI